MVSCGSAAEDWCKTYVYSVLAALCGAGGARRVGACVERRRGDEEGESEDGGGGGDELHCDRVIDGSVESEGESGESEELLSADEASLLDG